MNDVMPLMASMTEAKMIGRRLDCYVWGVDKSADRLISLEAKHGRLVNNSDSAAGLKVCVIDEQFAKKSYGRSNVVGKTLSLFLGGKYHEFEIIGVAHSGLSSLQGMLSNIMPGFMYIPISTMQQLTGAHHLRQAGGEAGRHEYRRPGGRRRTGSAEPHQRHH